MGQLLNVCLARCGRGWTRRRLAWLAVKVVASLLLAACGSQGLPSGPAPRPSGSPGTAAAQVPAAAARHSAGSQQALRSAGGANACAGATPNGEGGPCSEGFGPSGPPHAAQSPAPAKSHSGLPAVPSGPNSATQNGVTVTIVDCHVWYAVPPGGTSKVNLLAWKVKAENITGHPVDNPPQYQIIIGYRGEYGVWGQDTLGALYAPLPLGVTWISPVNSQDAVPGLQGLPDGKRLLCVPMLIPVK